MAARSPEKRTSVSSLTPTAGLFVCACFLVGFSAVTTIDVFVLFIVVWVVLLDGVRAWFVLIGNSQAGLLGAGRVKVKSCLCEARTGYGSAESREEGMQVPPPPTRQ